MTRADDGLRRPFHPEATRHGQTADPPPSPPPAQAAEASKPAVKKRAPAKKPAVKK